MSTSNLVSCNNLSVNNNLTVNGNTTTAGNIITTKCITGSNLNATSNVNATNVNITGQLNNLTLANLNSLDTTSSIQTQLNNCANSTNVVDLVTNQTIGGVKTFSSSPVVPTCTAMNNSTNVASTAYVDSAISALSSSAPSTLSTLNQLATALGDNPNFATTITNQIAGMGGLASNNAWSGTNTFANTTTLTGNLVANSQTLSPTVLSYLVGSSSNLQTQLNAKAVDADVVHNTTNETIAGVKTFTSAPVLPANSITDTMIDNSCISSGFCDATSSIQSQLTKITPQIYGLSGGTNVTLPLIGSMSYYCYQNTTATFTTTLPTGTLPTQIFIFINLGSYAQTIATSALGSGTGQIVYESINNIGNLTWNQNTFSLPVNGIVNLIFDGSNYFVLYNSSLDNAIYESLENQVETNTTAITKITPQASGLPSSTTLSNPTTVGSGTYYAFQDELTSTITVTLPTAPFGGQTFIFRNSSTYPQTIATGSSAQMVYESPSNVGILSWGSNSFSLLPNQQVMIITDSLNYFVLWGSYLLDGVNTNIQNQITTINGNITNLNANLATTNTNLATTNTNLQNLSTNFTTTNLNCTNFTLGSALGLVMPNLTITNTFLCQTRFAFNVVDGVCLLQNFSVNNVVSEVNYVQTGVYEVVLNSNLITYFTSMLDLFSVSITLAQQWSNSPGTEVIMIGWTTQYTTKANSNSFNIYVFNSDVPHVFEDPPNNGYITVIIA